MNKPRLSKTLVITSHKNFEWTSMQEIIPFIENLWLESESDDHHVEMLNFEKESLLKNIKKYLDFDNFVLTCFTTEIALAVSTLRRSLGLNFRIFFYVHGMASIAYWPLFQWKLGFNLRDSDHFVVTCEGDIKLTRLVFPKIQITKHPFLNFREIKKSTITPSNTNMKLVYIGRISEQKSLHTLICSLYLLKNNLEKMNVALDIFGGEDNLGSPNMGKESTQYLDFLKKLIEELKITHLVNFKGFVSRGEIDKYLGLNDVIFIAPSLHSDENFGMSPFNILKAGGRCVLTPWGGFAEFKEHFKEQVHYVDIYEGEYGPYLCPKNISKKLLQCISTNIIEKTKPDYYSYALLKDKIRSYAMSEKDNELQASHPTELALSLIEERKRYLLKEDKAKRNYGAKIYSDYRDKKAQKFLNGYAKLSKRFLSEGEVLLLPWIKIEKNKILIKDPRLGDLCVARENENEPTLTSKELTWLRNNGFSFN